MRNTKERICKFCGKIFFTRLNYKLFCSRICWNKNYSITKNKGYGTDKFKGNCLLCNKEFIKNVARQKFCSKQCSKIVYKNKYDKISNGENFEGNDKFSCFLKLRFEIFKRDNFRCQYCGRNPKDNKTKLVIDHIIPRIEGGSNISENLITACNECNLGKSDILLEERQLKNKIIKLY